MHRPQAVGRMGVVGVDQDSGSQEGRHPTADPRQSLSATFRNSAKVHSRIMVFLGTFCTFAWDTTLGSHHGWDTQRTVCASTDRAYGLTRHGGTLVWLTRQKWQKVPETP